MISLISNTTNSKFQMPNKNIYLEFGIGYWAFEII